MKQPIEFLFEVSHDKGTQRIRTKATTKRKAAEIIAQAEGCPIRALKPISKWVDYNYNTGYYVVKVGMIGEYKVVGRYKDMREAEKKAMELDEPWDYIHYKFPHPNSLLAGNPNDVTQSIKIK